MKITESKPKLKVNNFVPNAGIRVAVANQPQSNGTPIGLLLVLTTTTTTMLTSIDILPKLRILTT